MVYSINHRILSPSHVPLTIGAEKVYREDQYSEIHLVPSDPRMSPTTTWATPILDLRGQQGSPK